MKDATLFKVKIRLRRYSPCKNRSRINLISTCSILLFCKYKVVSDCSLTAANFCRLHTLVSSGRHVIRASSDHTYLFGAAYYVEVDAQQLDNCKLSSVSGRSASFLINPLFRRCRWFLRQERLSFALVREQITRLNSCGVVQCDVRCCVVSCGFVWFRVVL